MARHRYANPPAPGPRLLNDDGHPTVMGIVTGTYVASVERATGLPAFWGDGQDGWGDRPPCRSGHRHFDPQPTIGERYAIARRRGA
jgi:hypothetical protein